MTRLKRPAATRTYAANRSHPAGDKRCSLLERQFAESPDAVLILDAIGEIAAANRAFHELSGLGEDWRSRPPSEIQRCLSNMHIDPARTDDGTVDRPADWGTEVRNEFLLPDGRRIEFHSTPLYGAPGELLGRSIRYRDITIEREQQERLRESEELFRVVAETAPCGIWLQHAGQFVYVNSSLAEMAELPKHELLKPGALIALVNPEDRAEVLAAVSARMGGPDGSHSADIRIMTGDGTARWIRVRGRMAVIGGQEFGLGAALDITDARRAEAERDRLFQVSVDMLAITDSRGRFQRVNPAWTLTTGYEERELVGESVWHFVHPQDRAQVLAVPARVAGRETVRDLRLRFRTKNGSHRWLSWNIRGDSGDNGDAIYCAVRDITDLMAAETQTRSLLARLQSDAHALEAQAAEMETLRAKAEYEANHDGLTRLLNRRAWFGTAVATRPTALAVIDVDHFKAVNDQFGHPAGDQVLREVADRLRAVFEEGQALVGRVGGEEFAVQFSGSFGEATALLERALDVVRAAPVVLEHGDSIGVTLSAGLAPWRMMPSSREQSLAASYEQADRALFDAKQAGRDRFVARWLSAA